MPASSSDVIELARHEEHATVDGSGGEAPLLHGSDRPARIGRYVVLETIGRGGMGVVCTAYDPKLDRKVALKLLRQARGDRERQQSRRVRMLREAQALAKLSHPNVITVHDVDTFGDRLYIAMEYVEGLTISQWLRQKARTWQEIVDVFAHAGRGLAAAHEAGIVHRDFKPGNVLIGDDGRVRVLDFGLAKTAEDPDLISHETDGPDASDSLRDEKSKIAAVLGSATDLKLTQVGRAVGTPAYMAPEQFKQGRVGPHTDQFSFGVALYEALYGRLPFGSSADLRSLIDRVTEGRVIEPAREAGVPGWVQRVVMRALQSDPDARFASMHALLVALADDPARRRRRWLVGGAIALLAAGGGGMIFSAFTRPSEARCTGASARIDEVWNDTRRSSVQAAFLATRLSYAPRTVESVRVALDDFSGRWVATHTGVCEATNVRGEQSEALMDHRMACLERSRAELDALVGVFENADADVLLKAPSAVHALNAPDACAVDLPGAGESLPDNPASVQAIREVERRLARASGLESAGKYEAALEVARQARADAEDIGHGGTIARAMFQEAMGLRQVRKGQDAAKLFEATIPLATKAGLFELEARAWIFLVLIEGTQADRIERAIAHGIGAESAIERAGRPLELRARLAQHLAGVYAIAQRYDDAIGPATNAVELWQELHGANSLAVAEARIDRALILTGRKLIDEAERELRASQEVLERVYGREHPRVASTALNLGSTLLQREDAAGARLEYDRALSILRKVSKPDDLALTGPLMGLARVEQASAPERAREHLNEALKILDSQPQRSALRLAQALAMLGGLDLVSGRMARAENDEDAATESFEAAIARLERSIALYGEIHGPAHRSARRVQRQRCEALAHLGRLDAARAACTLAIVPNDEEDSPAETALAYARTFGSTASERASAEIMLRLAAGPADSGEVSPAVAARAQLALARLLSTQPRRKDDAIRAARLARELAAMAEDPAIIPELDRWERDRR